MFSAFFIRRPIVAIVLSIVIVIIGLVALSGLPIEQFPALAPPIVRVQGVYPGAGAEVVEQSVATPIEQQINGVDHQLSVLSKNSSDGLMKLDVAFEVGTDLNVATMLTQNRVQQAQSRLPQEVVQNGVTVSKVNPSVLMVVSVYSPSGAYDGLFLNNFAMINVRDQLLRVPGVSSVDLIGSEYAMRIWFNPDVMAKLQVTASDVIQAIREQNLQSPAGKIGEAPSPPGQELTLSVRAPGKLSTPEEFANVIVRETSDGRIIRVADVARVSLGSETYKSSGRWNGKPAAALVVYLLPGANQLESARGIYQTLQDLQQQWPADIRAVVGFDTTPAVEASIEEILHTLVEAIVLVLVVVFLFLQNWRATLIPLLTVPVSLIGTFAVFPLLGFSINTLSMFGLVLAIGIVVDDAIVVVEAVMHNIEKGMTPTDATRAAMQEVAGPVVAIALIFAAVFIPVGFLGGITGRMYLQFAITIAVSTLFSAFSALTLSPALSVLLLRPASQHSRSWLSPLYSGFNALFGRLTSGYVGLASRFVRRSVFALIAVAAFAAGTVWMVDHVPSGFVPTEDQGIVMMNVALPDAASQQRTDEVVRKVEAILASQQGIDQYNAVLGVSFLADAYTSNVASFFIRLKPWQERGALTDQRIIDEIHRKTAGIPQASIFAFQMPSIPGFGSASGVKFYLQDRSGIMSVAELQQAVETLTSAARSHPELGSIFTQFSARVPQVQVQIDREKTKKLGVPLNDAFAALQATMGGAYVNDFNQFGRLYRVYVQADAPFRQQASDIGRMYVRSATTQAMIPLASLVTASPSSGSEITYRYNLYRSVELSAQVAPGSTTTQAMEALDRLAAEVLPASMSIEYGGLSFEEQRAPSSLPTLVLAVVFVFLLLAAQYNSWKLPWSVLLGTPIAAFGAYLGIWVMGLENNVFVQIGLVLLIGLSAKNAILIVEFAKLRQQQGASVHDAAVESARLRFRPIIMTASAFILGVVPLMLATGSGAAARSALGTTVFFGMLVASIAGMIVAPGLFALIEGAPRSFRGLGMLIIGVLAVGGCRLGPDYERPHLQVAPAYQSVLQDSTAQALPVGLISIDGDTILQAYVNLALDSNRSLIAAYGDITSAAAAVVVAQSEFLPTIDAQASAGALQLSKNRFPGFSEELIGGVRANLGVSALVSWELDVFGRIHYQSEVEKARLAASEYGRRALELEVVSAVARTYYQLVRLDRLALLLDSAVASRREYLRLTQTLFDGGKTSELDLQQARAEVHRVEALVPQMVAARQATENAMNVLLGRSPGVSIRRAINAVDRVASGPLPSGVPAGLLNRRPDVLRAERDVVAATASIGVAQAGLFPRLAVAGDVSLQSLQAGNLFDVNSLASTAVGNLAQPIFNAGRNQARVRGAEGVLQQQQARYQEVVYQAIADVNNAWMQLTTGRERWTAERRNVEANRQVLRLSELRYRYGTAPYLQVLDAQRSLLEAQQSEIEAAYAVAEAVVLLYRAMGGGWE